MRFPNELVEEVINSLCHLYCIGLCKWSTKGDFFRLRQFAMAQLIERKNYENKIQPSKCAIIDKKCDIKIQYHFFKICRIHCTYVCKRHKHLFGNVVYSAA